jgi:hypothetical protein
MPAKIVIIKVSPRCISPPGAAFLLEEAAVVDELATRTLVIVDVVPCTTVTSRLVPVMEADALAGPVAPIVLVVADTALVLTSLPLVGSNATL